MTDGSGTLVIQKSDISGVQLLTTQGALITGEYAQYGSGVTGTDWTGIDGLQEMRSAIVAQQDTALVPMEALRVLNEEIIFETELHEAAHVGDINELCDRINAAAWTEPITAFFQADPGSGNVSANPLDGRLGVLDVSAIDIETGNPIYQLSDNLVDLSASEWSGGTVVRPTRYVNVFDGRLYEYCFGSYYTVSVESPLTFEVKITGTAAAAEPTLNQCITVHINGSYNTANTNNVDLPVANYHRLVDVAGAQLKEPSVAALEAAINSAYAESWKATTGLILPPNTSLFPLFEIFIADGTDGTDNDDDQGKYYLKITHGGLDQDFDICSAGPNDGLVPQQVTPCIWHVFGRLSGWTRDRVATEGDALWVEQRDAYYSFDGTQWTPFEDTMQKITLSNGGVEPDIPLALGDTLDVGDGLSLGGTELSARVNPDTMSLDASGIQWNKDASGSIQGVIEIVEDNTAPVIAGNIVMITNPATTLNSLPSPGDWRMRVIPCPGDPTILSKLVFERTDASGDWITMGDLPTLCIEET